MTADRFPDAREMLALEEVAPNLFRAGHNMDNGRGAIFGGQPLVQGLAAARRTVGGWPAHSLTGYFLRAGATARPMDYAVEVVRDGRRFATRRVSARQDGRPVFEMLCSFHDPEQGPQHAFPPAPDVPRPEALGDLVALTAANADRLPADMVALFRRAIPIELRLTGGERDLIGRASTHHRSYWLRVPSAATVDDPLDHQCVLALMSDFWLAGTVAAPHFGSDGAAGTAVVTLNHSLWFHAPVRADEWLLFATETPWAGDGRGLVRALVYDRDGRLVAGAAQEISMRPM